MLEEDGIMRKPHLPWLLPVKGKRKGAEPAPYQCAQDWVHQCTLGGRPSTVILYGLIVGTSDPEDGDVREFREQFSPDRCGCVV